MTDPLAPMPMSADDVADLVRRVRVKCEEIGFGIDKTSASAEAALDVMRYGISITEAGRRHKVSRQSVGQTLQRMRGAKP